MLRDPDASTVERLLAEQRESPFSYPEVGATATCLPEGYRHDSYEAKLGAGAEVFGRAADGLRTWQAHRGAGVSVHPRDATLAEGATVLLVIALGLARAVAACRIVYVDDQPRRFGFAYGTLDLHPEQGEESFTVEHDPGGSVWFRIAAFSKPHDPLARIGAPVTRSIQRRVTNGYLRSLERFVA